MKIPIESLNLQVLNVGLAYHNADWNWKDVSSPFTRIYYVKEGEATLHQPETSVRLRPGCLYIVPAYTTHSYECEGNFVHYYLHVFEGFKNEVNILEMYDLPTEVTACEDDERILQRMCEELPQMKLPSSNPSSYDNTTRFSDYVRRYHDMPLWQRMALRGNTLLLLSRFMRKAVPHVWTNDDRIKKVLDFIHKNIDQPITIDKLADVACLTKAYLIRLFQREFGTSPLQYINVKKVERAQLLLYTTDMPVKEVAYALGFADHSYFIRMFRKQTGITPLSYRSQMR